MITQKFEKEILKEIWTFDVKRKIITSSWMIEKKSFQSIVLYIIEQLTKKLQPNTQKIEKVF